MPKLGIEPLGLLQIRQQHIMRLLPQVAADMHVPHDITLKTLESLAYQTRKHSHARIVNL